jgi:hypothetical protein
MEKHMPRTALTGFVLLLLVPAAWALDDKDKPKLDPAAKPADEFKRLSKQFNDKQQETYQAYSKAATNEERQAILKGLPKASDYAGPMMELAEKSPKDPVAPDALVWVVEHVRAGGEADKALHVLLTDYPESKAVGRVCPTLLYSGSPKAEETLKAILGKSPHREVQAAACLALGQYLKNQTQRRNADPARRDELTKEAEKYLERVVAEYASVPYFRGTSGEAAQAELFEIRNLGIGKAAPEIEGEDLDGQKFKLSDYKGKVVVLDFWGSW